MHEMIEPTCKTITVDGQQITIGEIKVKQLPALKHAAEIITMAAETDDKKNIFLRFFAVGKVMPDLAPFFALITGQTEEWCLELGVSKLSLIIETFIEVNISFFTQATMPSIKRAIIALAAALTGQKT